MTHSLLKPILIITLAARVPGSSQPLDPILRGFTEGCEGQTQTCWYGIVFGQTTREEAALIATNKGYAVVGYPPAMPLEAQIGCRLELYANEGRIDGISLIDCEMLDLGSLINFAGQPDYLSMSCDGRPMVNYKFIAATLPDGHKIDPYSKVQLFIRMSFALDEMPSYPNVFHWAGFKSLHAYQRTQPGVFFPICGD